MSNIFAIKAEARTETGKISSKKLKSQGLIPSIIYGPGKEPKAIAVDFALIAKRHKQGRFYTQICEIELGSTKIKAIPRDLYRHPVTDNVEHVDFYELDEDTKVKIKAQIITKNDSKCKGVKLGGVLSHVVRRLELSCYPKDIVSEIAIDVTDLNIGDSVHVNDLQLPEGVEVITKDNLSLVTVIGRIAEVEEENNDEDAEAKVEVINEAKKEEEKSE